MSQRYEAAAGVSSRVCSRALRAGRVLGGGGLVCRAGVAMKAWRMKEMCAECPFQRSGPGAELRRSLRRWPDILKSVRDEKDFRCHMTTRETGNGTNLICAGAIAYQERYQCTSVYVQVMGRFERREKHEKHGRTDQTGETSRLPEGEGA